ncbi:hypothetical protein H4R21_005031 [Coemansia helicoidea]|uniref:Uncharacterized protein n=1 Tax=Coemansia helicoidea TaxID=1286919 RepID=A0ACC1KVZ7_9FUNG|nr:hypothetical protein H4R21_005031 [Coemansia helicoidea]
MPSHMICVHVLAADTREFYSISVDRSNLSQFTFACLASKLSTLQVGPATYARCGDSRDGLTYQLKQPRFGTSLQDAYDQTGAADDLCIDFTEQ